MHPELEKDVVGFECGIGGEFAAPIAVFVLESEEGVDCAFGGVVDSFGALLYLLARGGENVFD